MPVEFESAARARCAKQLCKPCKLRQSQPTLVRIDSQRAIGVCSQEQKHVGSQEQTYGSKIAIGYAYVLHVLLGKDWIGIDIGIDTHHVTHGWDYKHHVTHIWNWMTHIM